LALGLVHRPEVRESATQKPRLSGARVNLPVAYCLRLLPLLGPFEHFGVWNIWIIVHARYDFVMDLGFKGQSWSQQLHQQENIYSL
jgi:hypothetical protein